MGIGVAGLVISAISAVSTIVAQKKQSKATKKAEEAQRKQKQVDAKIASRENARQRRQAVREARIQRGQVIAGGANQGVLGSSGVQGGASSITSQAGGNIAAINATEGLSARRNMFADAEASAISDFNRAGANNSMFQSALSVGSSVASSFPSFSGTQPINSPPQNNVSQSGFNTAPQSFSGVAGQSSPINQTNFGR